LARAHRTILETKTEEENSLRGSEQKARKAAEGGPKWKEALREKELKKVTVCVEEGGGLAI